MTPALRRPIVMLVTSRARLAERVGVSPDDLGRITTALLKQIESAAGAGVSLIQLREPDLDTRALTALTRAAVRAVDGTLAQLIVSGRPDVAMATAAHGVHLPERGLPADRVRALLPRPAVVGVSIHAATTGPSAPAVDYAVFGTVYPTRSKPGGHELARLDGLRRAAEASDVPVLAIGGVTPGRLTEIAATGASGVAAIELFLPGPGSATVTDLRKILESVHEAFDTVRDVS